MFVLAYDVSPTLRTVVSGSFVYLASRLDYIAPYFDKIVPIIIEYCKDDDETIALSACEFWNLICENSNNQTDTIAIANILRPHLSTYVTQDTKKYDKNLMTLFCL